MGGKALLTVIAGIIVISTMIFLNITNSTSEIMANLDREYGKQVAGNIAQSGVNLGLRQLAGDITWRAGFPLMDVFGGKVAVRAVDTVWSGKNVVKVEALGYVDYGTSQEIHTTAVAYFSPGYIPTTVKGAVTTTHLAYAQGTMVVDGRDHLTTGVLTGTPTGTLGVWTLKNFNQTGGAEVGGTVGGVDYAPENPADPAIIAAMQSWPGGYPTSPDSMLGSIGNPFSAGTLKALAQSGAGGSQYVTNPAVLTYPLKGITFVEMSSGGTWDSGNLTGSGLLIVHNNTLNSILSNPTGGPFVGLVIGDEIVHINATIIGGIISMGGSEDDIINGSGSILFSRAAIQNIIGQIATGFGTKSTQNLVLAWRE